MRVIAGKYRSRVLKGPGPLRLRPTSDRLRETLFNVLTNGAVDRVDGKAFLDLYAGSGAVGSGAGGSGAGGSSGGASGASGGGGEDAPKLGGIPPRLAWAADSWWPADWPPWSEDWPSLPEDWPSLPVTMAPSFPGFP